jgi:hypothetical protein
LAAFLLVKLAAPYRHRTGGWLGAGLRADPLISKGFQNGARKRNLRTGMMPGCRITTVAAFVEPSVIGIMAPDEEITIRSCHRCRA